MAHWDSLVEEFESLNRKTQALPDVFEFLAERSVDDVAAIIPVLLVDQQIRWEIGAPLKVEEYVHRLPALQNHQNGRMRLAIGEFAARERGQESPSVEEYLSRFPDLSNSLASRLTEGRDADFDVDSQTRVIGHMVEVNHDRLGRYRLDDVLGHGAFGKVYLGFDDELERRVAIKVPKINLLKNAEDRKACLDEARMIAQLDHPHIVPIHDVGQTDEGEIYIVTKYIEGCTLGQFMRRESVSFAEATSITAAVAKALHHAHGKRLVHRDIKPENILLEESTGTPYVADFGLAIREEEFLISQGIAGTPSYMSPEQARGEGHRLDGRSDIFSLGVVFYELLTGKKPFPGGSTTEKIQKIIHEDPISPSTHNSEIPEELERICLKALSKRVAARFSTAAEMADDLLHWENHPDQSLRDRLIVPRGLRSFRPEDNEFFLDLLPGPRDRNRLPESIAFWKKRIEETDPDETFGVGLIYGPSGCGKSSLMQAGLLPRLSHHVKVIYISSDPDNTEMRLRNELEELFPDISFGDGLANGLSNIRRMQSLASLSIKQPTKLVIILDQFEQWLHSHELSVNSEIVKALRQCDGEFVQSIVMIRDDFAMDAVRLMETLEVPILQGHNFATVDLFDIDHASNVLVKFGQAYGKLPVQRAEMTSDQKSFVDSAVQALAQDGKVISIRIALLAEMLKFKPWHSESMKAVGGTEALGVQYLDETFKERSANPKHQLHEEAIREFLKLLLPVVGTDIRGQMQSADDLRIASGYQHQPSKFQELLDILEGDLRLISPTSIENADIESSNENASKYYQLTHDFLVPALREWLMREQRSTRRGRAEILLQERTEFWTTRRETRQLPTTLETLMIYLFTKPSKWILPQAEMMKHVARRELKRLGIASSILACSVVIGLWGLHQWELAQEDAQTNELVNQILVADINRVPELIGQLPDDGKIWKSRLQTVAEDSEATRDEKVRSHLTLCSTSDESLTELIQLVPTLDYEDANAMVSVLQPRATTASQQLWDLQLRLKDSVQQDAARLNLATLLASLDTESERWEEIGPSVAGALSRNRTVTFRSQIQSLAPVSGHLIRAVQEIFLNPKTTEASHVRCSEVLANYLEDQPELLVKQLVEAKPEAFLILFEKLKHQPDQGVPELLNLLNASNAGEQQKSRAVIALLKLDQASHAWPFLKLDDDPGVRYELIRSIASYEVPFDLLVEHAKVEPNGEILAAILLSLDNFDTRLVSADRLAEAKDWVSQLSRTHSDSEVHAASQKLFANWDDQNVKQHGKNVEFRGWDETYSRKNRSWWMTTGGQTMVTLSGPIVFTKGSPDGEAERDPIENLEEITIHRSFAISAFEVTVGQYIEKFPSHTYASEVAPNNDCPINKVSWYDAVRYCRKLSEDEGFPEDQMCYPELSKIGPEMKLPEDFLLRTSYRLPTEEEWEYACRSGSRTAFYFGNSPKNIAEYAWHVLNSNGTTHSVGQLLPNGFGLFDMNGNVHEWCHDLAPESLGGENATSTYDGVDVHGGHPFFRGGGYRSTNRSLRSAKRFTYPSDSVISTHGFRIARTIK